MPSADSDNSPLAGRKEERLLFIRIGQLTAGDGLPIPIAPQHFIQVQAPIRERDSVLVKTYPFRLDASLESANSKARKLLEDAIDSKDASLLTDSSPAFQEISAAGALLFETLCQNEEISRALNGLLINVDDHPFYLFCQLQCDIEAAAAYFWEALSYPHRLRNKLFMTSDKAVAIHVPSARHWLGPMEAPEAPLKILMVSSSYGPNGRSEGSLKDLIQLEWQGIEFAWKDFAVSRLVELRHVADPTVDRLRNELDDFHPHVLHYYGHGFLRNGGDECIVLDNGSGIGQAVTWDRLSEIFSSKRTEHLRLVVLNACRLEARAQVGNRLAELGVPAVISMRATVHADVVTGLFTPAFHGTLAKGKFIHEAFREAQETIRWNRSRAVEAFVPTLIHGSLRGIPLLDLSRADVRRAWQTAEDQRRDAIDMANSLQQAYIKADGNWHLPIFHDAVTRSVKFKDEPRVAAAFEEIARDMAGKLNAVQNDRDWRMAISLVAASKLVATGLPQDAAEEFLRECGEMDLRVKLSVETKKADLRKLKAGRDWARLEIEVQPYLEILPDDPEFRALSREAHECTALEINILDEEEVETGAPGEMRFQAIRELIQSGKLQEADQLYRASGRALTSTEQREYQKLMQAAIARRSRQELERTRNAVMDLRMNGEWEEADRECAMLRRSLERSSPDWPGAIQLHCSVRESWARQVELARDWKTLRSVARRILDDPEMRVHHGIAEEWLASAAKYIELSDDIRVL